MSLCDKEILKVRSTRLQAKPNAKKRTALPLLLDNEESYIFGASPHLVRLTLLPFEALCLRSPLV